MYAVAYEKYMFEENHISIEICNDGEELFQLFYDLGILDDEETIIDENGYERPKYLTIKEVIDYLKSNFIGDGSFSVVSISILDIETNKYLLRE